MKTVIEMAVAVGIDSAIAEVNSGYLERFAELIRADEREACAKVADEMTRHSFLGAVGAAIRARGESK